MQNQLTEKVAFDLIRYANCWEDADVLLEGLEAQQGSKILSIASAGDNSFSLLTTEPELVVAIDVNKIQLYLVELKKVCFEYLTHEEMIAFLGFRESEKRAQTFFELKYFLSDEAQKYWESNVGQIEVGIISQGKFEKYFQLFSQKMLPWIHSQKTVEELFKPKSAVAQKSFYDKKWNIWRWKGLFKIFFSKYVMGKYGRDPQFLNEVKIPVGDFIFQRAAQHLASARAQNNFMLRYNLTGSFGEMLPHYLQPGNFDKIKSNLHKLHLREGYAEEAVHEFGKFHYMNLSNIFEYMDNNLFADTAKKLIESLEVGGKMAYWNLMVPRNISEIFREQMNFEKHISEKLSKQDKGFFYNQFIINQRK